MTIVRSLIKEMESLDKELKETRKKIQTLNKRKKTLKDQIVQNMIRSKEKSCKIQGQVYKIEEFERRTRKKESEKKHDVIEFLKEYTNKPDELYNQIREKMRGKKQQTFVLKNENSKNKKIKK